MCLAVPGKIISIDNKSDLMPAGRVSFGGVIKEVNLAFVPDAQIDNYVLVHAGFAISVINEEQALQAYSDIKQIYGNEESA